MSHVGIYIGDGDFIHASTSKGVIISSMDERYYTSHYHSCGRVEALGKRKLCRDRTGIGAGRGERPKCLKAGSLDTSLSTVCPAVGASLRQDLRRISRRALSLHLWQ